MTPLITHYLFQLRRRLPMVILVSIVVFMAVYTILRRQGVIHEVHFSYIVSLEDRQQTAQYQFDGYYTLQAIELFTDTLSNLITTPELLVRAYEQAKLPLPNLTARTLQGAVTAEQIGPQLVHVTVRDKNREVAEKLSKSLMNVVGQDVEVYQNQGKPAVKFQIVASEPWTGQAQLNILLVAVGSGLFIFFIGINLVLLWEGLKQL